MGPVLALFPVVNALFRFPSASRRDDAVERWFECHSDGLGRIAKEWFDLMWQQSECVCMTLHDGWPTACVGDAAFGYVAPFRQHVNVGFFQGASLPDPGGILEGTGKRMRHVKVRADGQVDRAALRALIAAAYRDMRRRTSE